MMCDLPEGRLCIGNAGRYWQILEYLGFFLERALN